MSKVFIIAGLINRILKAVFFVLKENEDEKKKTDEKKGK